MEVAGTDATAAYEDVGHSQDADEIMQGFLVGVMNEADTKDSGEASSAGPEKTVQIVRRPVVQEVKSKSSWSHQVTKLAKYASILVGLGGAIWTLQGHNPKLLFLSSNGSFVQGVVVSLSICGAVVAAGIHYLQKATSFDVDFSSFSPRQQSSSSRIIGFHPTGVLTASEYRKYTIREKKELADGIWRFVFDLPSKYAVLGLPIGQHIAIRASIGEQTVVRSYTPVSNNRDLGRLELLIRVYPDGMLGNYLKGLNPGDKVDIRGPKGAMRYRKGMSKAIGMVAGGTGITPMYQLIRAICEDNNDDTRVVLIYGNRSEPDILLRHKLDHFATIAGHKFTVHYTLDQPPADWKGGKCHVTKDLLQRLMPQPTNENKVMLCGPPGMVNATKKNLIELGFKEPDSVGNMADQIFCF